MLRNEDSSGEHDAEIELAIYASLLALPCCGVLVVSMLLLWNGQELDWPIFALAAFVVPVWLYMLKRLFTIRDRNGKRAWTLHDTALFVGVVIAIIGIIAMTSMLKLLIWT